MSSAANDVLRFPFESVAEPYVPEEYRRLRDERPVQRVELPYGGAAWLVTRYADVRMVYSDPRFSRAAAVEVGEPRATPAPTPPGDMNGMDPPEHSRLRRLVAGAFTKMNVQRWRPRADAVVKQLVADMRTSGHPVDLVSAFSGRLSITVICELFGVPSGDRHRFEHFANVTFGSATATMEEMVAACAELEGCLAEYIAVRRAQRPEERSQDLLTDLVEARDNTDRLSERELLQLGVAILIAGHETTSNQLSSSVFFLLDTGLWRRLGEQPASLESAIEELLRYVRLIRADGQARVATEDVEISGHLIRKGEAVIPAICAANHDESVFENPDRLDLFRERNPHVAFGYGAHRCLGAQLARMELQAGLAGLLDAFPTLCFAGAAEDVRWRVGTFIRGPEELLLGW